MSFQSRNGFDHATPARFTSVASRHATLTARMAAMLKIWRGRVAARRYLAELDARSLREAGISPAAAAFECGKPFWREMGPLR